MTFARLCILAATLVATPALAATTSAKKATKKHATSSASKKTHVASKSTAKKKSATTANHAIAKAAPAPKSEDAPRLASADVPAARPSADMGEGDSEAPATGSRRVITHSTAAPDSDTAE
jgi:hypothetical protein